MLYAQMLRSPHPHARIKSIDLSKARALPGVKAIVTHENCHYVWGAGSTAGGVQYNDDIKKITTQRRYAFNNPVRYVGEPIAAVAAVDRHVAEEAVRLITVDYEVLPFVSIKKRSLKDDSVKIWAEGNISPDARNQFQPTVQKHGNVQEWLQERGPGFEGATARDVPQRADGAALVRGLLGRRQAHGLHADGRHCQLPSRHGA
jgi:CO/xanthine dehydrogenase Mo-binding subunit